MYKSKLLHNFHVNFKKKLLNLILLGKLNNSLELYLLMLLKKTLKLGLLKGGLEFYNVWKVLEWLRCSSLMERLLRMEEF